MLPAEKKGIDQAIGASRGGQTTKIHMVADSHGNPIYFEISGGQVHDARMAAGVIAQSSGEWIMADKGYDSAEIRRQISGHGSIPIIPQRRGNLQQNPHFDSDLYKARHLVENLFAKLKHFRGFATRFDKLARNFLSSISLAAIAVWARL